MTREEAIDVYNGLINTKIKEAFEFFAPELRESEDERIRKEMIDFLKSEKAFQTIDLPISERWISYLEKQKELFKSGRGLYYYDGEKTTYCGYPATEDNPYDFAISQQEKQKEQKPISFNEPYNPDDYEVVMEGNATSLKRKEQKPWKVGANAYFTPEQKPAEWSDEDEKIITRLIDYFESFRIAGVATKWEGLGVQEVITLLKSLRPSWKPSEEQMEALRTAMDRNDSIGYHLGQLHEQLKKL